MSDCESAEEHPLTMCLCSVSPSPWTGVGQPVNEFFSFLGEGEVPQDNGKRAMFTI